MRIGDFVINDLKYYPQKKAAVIYTEGCNFRYGYCQNPQLVLPSLFPKQQKHTPEQVLEYLKTHRSSQQAVVVTGGEPTVHDDLPVFLKQIKQLGYSIKLDTNGSHPFMLEQIINESLVDYIAMDIKIPIEDGLYSRVIGISDVGEITENILVSVILLKSASTRLDVEFRTTCIPGVHNEGMITLIRKFLGQNSLYKTYEYRDNCTLSMFN